MSTKQEPKEYGCWVDIPESQKFGNYKVLVRDDPEHPNKLVRDIVHYNFKPMYCGHSDRDVDPCCEGCGNRFKENPK